MPLRVILVSCGAQKRAVPSAARELYTGPLFTAARRYAEASGAAWWILSARYGLLHPDREVAPYDLALTSLDREAREGWARAIVGELAVYLPGLGWRPGRAGRPGSPVTLELHAGVAYTAPLMGCPVSRESWTWEAPLAGLEVGQRLSWYRRAREAVAGEQLVMPWAG